MLAALIWNPTAMIFSSLLLVSSVAIWISLSGDRLRIGLLTALLLAQSANIALAAMNTPSHIQLPVLATSFVALSLQWVLIALACLPRPSHSSEVTEPTT